MTAAFDFGALRSLLQQAPSPQIWSALCERLFPMSAEAHADLWLPYALDHLDRRWPDTLRTWPTRWRDRKRPPAANALVRWASVSFVATPYPRERLDELRRAALPLIGLHTYALSNLELVDHLAACLPETLAELHLRNVPIKRGAALLDLPLLDRLRCLCLDHTSLDHDAASALFDRDLSALTKLSLAENTLYGEDVRALASHPMTARLASLDLSYTAIKRLNASKTRASLTSSGLDLLAQARWPALTTLGLSGVAPRGESLNAALAQMPALSELRLSGYTDTVPLALPALSSLDLSDAQLPDETLAQMLAAPALAASLTQLTLSGVRVGPATMRALASLPALRSLSLCFHRETPPLAGAFAALAKRTLPALTSLDLRWGTLDLATIRALCAIDMPALRELHIHLYGGASDPRRRLIQRASWFPQLAITHTHYDRYDPNLR